MRYLKLLYSTALCFLLMACGSGSTSNDTPLPDLGREGPSDIEIVRIPVVVHVIYYDDQTNVTTEKIESQIQILNEDFRKLNTDYTQTPDEFLPLVADVGIEFELASIDPEGNVTNGITRTESDITGITPGEDGLAVYSTALGGHDAWPAEQYLNIWTVDMADRNGQIGEAGFASFPGGDPRFDGVVIEPRAFGVFEPLAPTATKGRTATHEIGHWLNLLHIYAGKGNCDTSDGVDDTPNALTQYEEFPVYPRSSCGSTDITMNFMDNVDDRAMYMFTNGQRKRMRAVFKEGGGRHQLYLNNLNYGVD